MLIPGETLIRGDGEAFHPGIGNTKRPIGISKWGIAATRREINHVRIRLWGRLVILRMNAR